MGRQQMYHGRMADVALGSIRRRSAATMRDLGLGQSSMLVGFMQ